MKNHATSSTPLGGAFWDEGAKVFIKKGTNGRWKDLLTEADSLQYEKKAAEELGTECAHWLKTGKFYGNAPRAACHASRGAEFRYQ